MGARRRLIFQRGARESGRRVLRGVLAREHLAARPRAPAECAPSTARCARATPERSLFARFERFVRRRPRTAPTQKPQAYEGCASSMRVSWGGRRSAAWRLRFRRVVRRPPRDTPEKKPQKNKATRAESYFFQFLFFSRVAARCCVLAARESPDALHHHAAARFLAGSECHRAASRRRSASGDSRAANTQQRAALVWGARVSARSLAASIEGRAPTPPAHPLPRRARIRTATLQGAVLAGGQAPRSGRPRRGAPSTSGSTHTWRASSAARFAGRTA